MSLITGTAAIISGFMFQ